MTTLPSVVWAVCVVGDTACVGCTVAVVACVFTWAVEVAAAADALLNWIMLPKIIIKIQ